MNGIGQRTKVEQSGTAFSVAGTSNASFTLDWTYNARGELTTEDHSDDTRDNAYRFDGIGNREAAIHDSLTVPGTDNYTANSSNEYTATPSTFATSHDGNGNVTQYINESGAYAARWEYDSFGRTTKVYNGSIFATWAMLHRFSTKVMDYTTGLHFYGYRWYNSYTGRWPSRDPIGERGGVNLYGMVGNDAVGRWDYLGLQSDSQPLRITCDCFSIGANIVTYKKVERQIKIQLRNGQIGEITEYGADALFHLTVAYDWNNPKCDGCDCTEIKMIQFSRTGNAGGLDGKLADFRYKRSIKRGVYDGWRVDTTEGADSPYVSDLPGKRVSHPNSGYWSGYLEDGPGESGTRKTLQIFTCLMCTKGDLYNGKPKIIACIGWGVNFSTKKEGAAGELDITLRDPTIHCGGAIDSKNQRAGTFQGLANNAIEQFTSNQ